MAILITITLLVLVAILLYQYVTFTRLYYFNSSLSHFKELRHSSTLFITDKMDELTVDELQQHQEFLIFVNRIVKNFDDIKFDVSRFKFIKAIFNQLIFSSNTLAQIRQEHCASLDEFKRDYRTSVEELFKATPFFRTRTAIYLARILFSVLVPFGFAKLKNRLKRLDELMTARENVSACFS